jgi:hypothetical protein
MGALLTFRDRNVNEKMSSSFLAREEKCVVVCEKLRPLSVKYSIVERSLLVKLKRAAEPINIGFF